MVRNGQKWLIRKNHYEKCLWEQEIWGLYLNKFGKTNEQEEGDCVVWEDQAPKRFNILGLLCYN